MAFEEISLKCLYFDGHKDNTLQQIPGHQKLTSDAYVAIIEESSNKYTDR